MPKFKLIIEHEVEADTYEQAIKLLYEKIRIPDGIQVIAIDAAETQDEAEFNDTILVGDFLGGYGTRIINGLRGIGITKYSQLCRCAKQDIRRANYIGRKGVDAIESALKSRGLRLAGE